MKRPKKGFAPKFLLMVTLLTGLLLVGMAAVIMVTAKQAQSRQAGSFIETLKAEQVQQEQLLRQGLLQKGKSLAELLAKTGAGLIIGYDFVALQQVADSAVRDGDVMFVTFYNQGGKPLTKASEPMAGTEVLRQEILFEGDPVGALEIGLSFASASEAVAEVSGRIANLVAATSQDMEASSRTLALRIALAAAVAILVLCGAIYTCLRLCVTKPLRKVMTGLDNASLQVTDTSDQLSAASHQFAEGASEQAAALEETSSSLEEMAATIRQNAENASEGDQLMKEADKVLGKANQSMARQTDAMAEISKASEETSKIIKTIDEIAFQTNLLALNAAVEAARAGEAGAGFAVVADEVRNLAMRAAEAAKSTAVLIEGTTKKVKEGEEMVTRTNEDFSEVSAIVSKVEVLVAGIAEASREQTHGIEQINRAVSEIDQVTQRTAAGAEEAASASEIMTGQADSLQSLVHDLLSLVGGETETEQQNESRPPRRASKDRIPSQPARQQGEGSSPPPRNSAGLLPGGPDSFEDF